MKLRPLDDRVVIKQSESQEKTAGGIILPDNAKEKPQIGKIIAVGSGKLLDDGKRSKMSVKK
ncbi:MAG: co-chaperone GroES, partial [Phycisphaerae bacterium]